MVAGVVLVVRFAYALHAGLVAEDDVGGHEVVAEDLAVVVDTAEDAEGDLDGGYLLFFGAAGSLGADY